MTAHDHADFVPGCYRCELSREEVAAQTPDHITRAVEVLNKAVVEQSSSGKIRINVYSDAYEFEEALIAALDAAGLFASPKHDAVVATRAWREGHTAGVRNASAEFDGPVQDNPYPRRRAR